MPSYPSLITGKEATCPVSTNSIALPHATAQPTERTPTCTSDTDSESTSRPRSCSAPENLVPVPKNDDFGISMNSGLQPTRTVTQPIVCQKCGQDTNLDNGAYVTAEQMPQPSTASTVPPPRPGFTAIPQSAQRNMSSPSYPVPGPDHDATPRPHQSTAGAPRPTAIWRISNERQTYTTYTGVPPGTQPMVYPSATVSSQPQAYPQPPAQGNNTHWHNGPSTSRQTQNSRGMRIVYFPNKYNHGAQNVPSMSQNPHYPPAPPQPLSHGLPVPVMRVATAQPSFNTNRGAATGPHASGAPRGPGAPPVANGGWQATGTDTLHGPRSVYRKNGSRTTASPNPPQEGLKASRTRRNSSSIRS